MSQIRTEFKDTARGTVTKVSSSPDSFHLKYQSKDDEDVTLFVNIPKSKLSAAHFNVVADSLGKPIEVTTNNSYAVTDVKIDGLQILSR